MEKMRSVCIGFKSYTTIVDAVSIGKWRRVEVIGHARFGCPYWKFQSANTLITIRRSYIQGFNFTLIWSHRWSSLGRCSFLFHWQSLITWVTHQLLIAFPLCLTSKLLPSPELVSTTAFGARLLFINPVLQVPHCDRKFRGYHFFWCETSTRSLTEAATSTIILDFDASAYRPWHLMPRHFSSISQPVEEHETQSLAWSCNRSSFSCTSVRLRRISSLWGIANESCESNVNDFSLWFCLHRPSTDSKLLV